MKPHTEALPQARMFTTFHTSDITGSTNVSLKDVICVRVIMHESPQQLKRMSVTGMTRHAEAHCLCKSFDNIPTVTQMTFLNSLFVLAVLFFDLIPGNTNEL